MPYADADDQRRYQREWIRQRRLGWMAANGPCRDCGSWENLEVHHEDPEAKDTHRVWTWSGKRREHELSKCAVLCELCHKDYTKKRLQFLFSRPITHGTISAYLKRKCKCGVCSSFYRKWRRNKYERLGV